MTSSTFRTRCTESLEADREAYSTRYATLLPTAILSTTCHGAGYLSPCATWSSTLTEIIPQVGCFRLRPLAPCPWTDRQGEGR